MDLHVKGTRKGFVQCILERHQRHRLHFGLGTRRGDAKRLGVGKGGSGEGSKCHYKRGTRKQRAASYFRHRVGHG